MAVLFDKLCYCKGTTWHAMLAKIRAMFHKVWELERVQTAKVTFKVIQRHWHFDFLLLVQLLLCLYLAPLTIYYYLFHYI